MMRRLPLLLVLASVGVLPAGAQNAADYDLPPLSSVTAIVERPLFDPDRRGPAAAASPTPAASTATVTGETRLLGAARQGGQVRALLSVAGTARSLTPGQEIAGWRLVAVDKEAAIFQAPDGRSLRLAVGDRLPPNP